VRDEARPGAHVLAFITTFLGASLRRCCPSSRRPCHPQGRRMQRADGVLGAGAVRGAGRRVAGPVPADAARRRSCKSSSACSSSGSRCRGSSC
jgi:hypothetical protein